ARNRRLNDVAVGVVDVVAGRIRLQDVEIARETEADPRQVGTDIEPELVLDDGPAEVEADVARAVQTTAGADRVAVGRELRLALKGRVVAEERAVELVGTALGDDVEDGAAAAPVLGQVAAGNDVRLFDEVDAERRAVVAEAGIADGEAVDHVL